MKFAPGKATNAGGLAVSTLELPRVAGSMLAYGLVCTRVRTPAG